MKFWAVYRQTIFVLMLCGLGGLLAGTVLGNMTEALGMVPGLIVLIPAIIAMKGNIFTTLGSRLGSAAHMGLIGPSDMFNEELYENIKGTMFLAVVMSFVIGVFASVSSLLLYVFDLVSFPNIVAIMIISVIATAVTSVVLVGFTVAIVYIAFRRGLDLDNITGPVLATLGDFIALMSIFGITTLTIFVWEKLGWGL